MSFWAPGQFGSLAALPSAPGWSVASIYYHASSGSNANKNFKLGGRITAGLDARPDLLFVSPTYTFADAVAGGQAALGAITAYGQAKVGIDAVVSGPRGTQISGAASDSQSGGSDL